jgi:hypothetical protein
VTAAALPVLLSLAMGSCAACHRQNAETSAAPASAPPGSSPVAATAALPASTSSPPPDPGAPAISATVETAAGGDVYQGWPLIVTARLSAQVPATIAAPGGDWVGALHVEIVDGAGKTVEWPLHLATQSPGVLSLDRKNVGYAGWWLSPDETARLGPGDVRVTVRLDTRGATQGWKGAASSAPLPLHVRPAPAPLTDRQQAAHAMRLADWHMLQGDEQAASADVDALLAQAPDDVPGLTLKGDLLMAAGHPADAVAQYDRAVAVVATASAPGAEPPRLLLAKRRAARQALDGGR